MHDVPEGKGEGSGDEAHVQTPLRTIHVEMHTTGCGNWLVRGTVDSSV